MIVRPRRINPGAWWEDVLCRSFVHVDGLIVLALVILGARNVSGHRFGGMNVVR
jgi:hypothetical protein